jgi:Circadian oscillating protein COP23
MRQGLFSQGLTRFLTIFGIASLTAFSVNALINQPSYAIKATFFCEMKNSVPTTFVSTSDGKKIAMIRWVSQDYFSKDLSPLGRCQQVSRRFQKNLDNGTLRTIVTGTLNGLPVVCAAVSTNDRCTNSTMLFTLKRGANARLAVERLLDRRGLASGKIQNQSNDDTQIYVDFDTYLNSVPAE